jgi:hypothetical protein
VILTHLRHKSALEKTAASLEEAQTILASGKSRNWPPSLCKKPLIIWATSPGNNGRGCPEQDFCTVLRWKIKNAFNA